MNEYTDVIDEAITALARHYGRTEAEIASDLADMWEWDGRSVLLEKVTRSLIAALSTLNDYGFDDGAVSAAEAQVTP